MEILKKFLNKYKETLDIVKGIIEEKKTINPDNYNFYSGIEITFRKPQYDWLEKHNNGDIIPMRHTYKGDVMGLLEINECPFHSFFGGCVPYIKKFWDTDNLIIKNHSFDSLEELLNSKVKSLEMVHRVRKNSLKRTGKFYISRCLKDLEGNQIPYCSAPVCIKRIENKEHPLLIAEAKIKELMNPVYEDAEKNLKGIVVPYTFKNGATTHLELKNIEFWVVGGPKSLRVQLIFHFYKNKKGSYGTHRTYQVINEVIDFKKSINV